MKIPIPSLFRKDLGRKFVALFFAVLIWFAIDVQLRDYDDFHNVPVNLRYDRSSIMVEAPPEPVTVTLKGASKYLQRLESNDIRVTVKIPSVPEGIYSYDLRISDENVICPPGTRVTDIAPARQLLRLDRIIRKKKVPVRVRFEGQLPEGFRIIGSSVSPPALGPISGPSRILRDISHVVTEPVLLDENVTEDFELEVALVAEPKVTLSDESVRVKVEIHKHDSRETYRELGMHLLDGAEAGLRVKGELPKVTVTLRGPRLTLDALDSQSIRPFIDITRITSSGRYRPSVHVWIDGAAGVTAELINPSAVDITLEAGENVKQPDTDDPKKAGAGGTGSNAAPPQ